MSEKEFQAAKIDPLTPKLHLCVLSLYEEAHLNGDHAPLAWLLDRAIGKPTDGEIPDWEEEREAAQLEGMSDAQLLELAQKKLTEFKAA